MILFLLYMRETLRIDHIDHKGEIDPNLNNRKYYNDIRLISIMEKRKITAFSIAPDLMRKIDAARGMIPRSRYVEMLILKGFEKMEAKDETDN